MIGALVVVALYHLEFSAYLELSAKQHYSVFLLERVIGVHGAHSVVPGALRALKALGARRSTWNARSAHTTRSELLVCCLEERSVHLERS